MNLPPIISFGSQAKSGKDYATSIVLKTYPGAVRVAFADELKARLRRVLELDRIDPFTTDPVLKEKIRPLLVGYGMSMRNLDEDYWVKEALRCIENFHFNRPLVVISDARFENELRVIQRAGGTHVEIIPVPDLPFVNEEERFNSPRCRARADHLIQNRFTPDFDHEVLSTVARIMRERAARSQPQPELTHA